MTLGTALVMAYIGRSLTIGVTMSLKFVALVFLALTQIAFAQVSKLSAQDSLEKVVRHFNQIWTDNNISTGTTRMTSGQWKVASSAIEKTQATLLVTEVRKDAGKKGQISKVQTISKIFSTADVTNLVKAYAEGNDFSPNNREDFISGMGQVYAILAKLSANGNKDIKTVTAKATYTEDGESRNVYLTSFTSISTNKTVLFFVIQGTL